jgi:large subunit ribosomal protein L21
MYAIVKTGGKQYPVEQGQTLVVERLRADEGAKVELQPLLYVDGDTVVDGEDLS